MKLEELLHRTRHLKDADDVKIECDHPQHVGDRLMTVRKQAAKRNLAKNGDQFVCRTCHMSHKNPMNQESAPRQTDELVEVFCHCEDHDGEPSRMIKRSAYFGPQTEPYSQICRTCSQRGKEISAEVREKISQTLTGHVVTEETKKKLSDYMKNNPEGIERGKENLIPGYSGGWNKGMEMSQETRDKMSASHVGKVFSDEHRQNISEGRKRMLEETGGFTEEHRNNLSEATIRAYQNGFNPNTHHVKGYHQSPKAGEVFYRSSYEAKAFQKLDADDSVVGHDFKRLGLDWYAFACRHRKLPGSRGDARGCADRGQ